jgi:hypothetical protein
MSSELWSESAGTRVEQVVKCIPDNELAQCI